MTYTIALMTYDDVPQVAEIERRCFPDPWSERMLREHLDNQCAAALVARGEDGTILGYGGLLVVLDEGYITNVAVSPDCRRQGVGRALIGTLVSHAGAQGLAFVTLEARTSNMPAIALYENAGFQKVGVRKNFYTAPVEDALLMTFFLKG